MKSRFFTLAFAFVFLVVFCGCGPAPLDQTDPRNVVQRLFDAANADDPTMLAGLCDPDHQNDGDTDCICALDPGYAHRNDSLQSRCRLSWEGFKTNFSKGSIKGEPKIHSHDADIQFYWGKHGRSPHLMHLVRKGDKWYLKTML